MKGLVSDVDECGVKVRFRMTSVGGSMHVGHGLLSMSNDEVHRMVGYRTSR